MEQKWSRLLTGRPPTAEASDEGIVQRRDAAKVTAGPDDGPECRWFRVGDRVRGKAVDAGRWDCTVQPQAEGASTAWHRVMDAARSGRH